MEIGGIRNIHHWFKGWTPLPSWIRLCTCLYKYVGPMHGLYVCVYKLMLVYARMNNGAYVSSVHIAHFANRRKVQSTQYNVLINKH